MCVLMLQNVVEQIHTSGRQIVLSLTGGGSGAISSLLQVAGASASILEIVVPYSSNALDDWVRGPIEQYCSEMTARAMAMRAFERARELTNADASSLCGMGATASLATNRPKRGAHRIHVSWQSTRMTAVTTCAFTSGGGTRAEEEHVATQLLLRVLAEACGVIEPWSIDTSLQIELTCRAQSGAEAWSELLLGRCTSVSMGTNSSRATPDILFPGAFNPPHWGHERMAEIASQRYGRSVTFELSIINVDKRPLDFIEIADRLERLAGRPVLLTRAATFVEKSQLAPGCIFVVGVDTIERIADPAYYGGDAAQRDEAISTIAARGCRFLVFGRTIAGSFATLSQLHLPPQLRAICDEVTESEFNAEVSSTDLRSKTG